MVKRIQRLIHFKQPAFLNFKFQILLLNFVDDSQQFINLFPKIFPKYKRYYNQREQNFQQDSDDQKPVGRRKHTSQGCISKLGRHAVSQNQDFFFSLNDRIKIRTVSGPAPFHAGIPYGGAILPANGAAYVLPVFCEYDIFAWIRYIRCFNLPDRPQIIFFHFYCGTYAGQRIYDPYAHAKKVSPHINRNHHKNRKRKAQCIPHEYGTQFFYTHL
ncbi:MAG: hypothetical protein K1W31_14680 [Lachnospiraceae bacterium]